LPFGGTFGPTPNQASLAIMPERASDGANPSQPNPPTRKLGLTQEYAALEKTLSATPVGRWFLAEYARRNRIPETQMLLDAIARLEAAVLKPQRQVAAPAIVLAELVEMSEAIARTRREIAQIRPPHQFDKQLINATEELDHIVEATKKVTSEILLAAEEIQEAAWTLREKNIAVDLCDKIDQRTTEIYTACSFQDITRQRTGKVVRVLRFIEQRINAMLEIWGVDDIAYKVRDIASKIESFADEVAREEARRLHGPEHRGEGLRQADVGEVMTEPKPQSEAPSSPPEAKSQGFERPKPPDARQASCRQAGRCSAREVLN
jgi:chemotaxis protein CheZ